MLIRLSPSTSTVTKDSLSKLQVEQLRVGLTYTDQKAVFELQRLKRNARWYSEEEFKEKTFTLKSASKVCLLKDEGSVYSFPAGSTEWVAKTVGMTPERQWEYPEPKILPWATPPAFEMYSYQKEAVETLLKANHGAISLPTGTGKSMILLYLIKNLGLKTVVMTPSTNVSGQLASELELRFGKKYVGRYFDTKKEAKKLITVANAQSLTRIDPKNPNWDLLSKTQVLISDESHTTPSATQAKVCFGLLSNTPYRFFLSATQMRNDGSDLLLDGIIGPIVYRLSFRECVEKSYLARPSFEFIHVPSNGTYESPDPMKMTRKHLFYNPEVAKKVGRLCNLAVRAGMPTLVLIEEIEQFSKLLPYLRVPASFAHGALTEENKGDLPPEYWESDIGDLVSKFNSREIKLLVGTSCISTGVDTKPTRFLIYWQGGKSEVQITQAIGRGTRKDQGKTKVSVIDFWIDSPSGDPLKKEDGSRWGLGWHSKERKRIYEELLPGSTSESVLE